MQRSNFTAFETWAAFPAALPSSPPFAVSIPACSSSHTHTLVQDHKLRTQFYGLGLVPSSSGATTHSTSQVIHGIMEFDLRLGLAPSFQYLHAPPSIYLYWLATTLTAIPGNVFVDMKYSTIGRQPMTDKASGYHRPWFSSRHQN